MILPQRTGMPKAAAANTRMIGATANSARIAVPQFTGNYRVDHGEVANDRASLPCKATRCILMLLV